MIIENAGREIDHIVYCVQDLDLAMEWFEKQTGVRPQFGGYHTSMGTKNALVGLGGQRYLEMLAVDNNNKKIDEPRWMGVDLICKSQFTRWAIKSDQLKRDAQIINEFDDEFGQINGGQRLTSEDKLLKWEMVMPLAEPVVDLIPFMVDWGESVVHPAENLNANVEFVSLQFAHPKPELIQPVFEKLGISCKIVECVKPGIFLEINTPNGVVEL